MNGDEATTPHERFGAGGKEKLREWAGWFDKSREGKLPGR